MLIFDAHLDLAFNAVDWNRDLHGPREIRAGGTLKLTDPGRGTNTVSFPSFAKGMGLGVATLFAAGAGDQPRVQVHDAGSVLRGAMSHLHYYRAMERWSWMRPIRTRGDLNRHVIECRADAAGAPFGYILSMECARRGARSDNIHEWHDLGLRAIGLTHYGANRYGGGTRNRGRLSPPMRCRFCHRGTRHCGSI